MENTDFELLEKMEKGGHVFRPQDTSDLGRAAFQHAVDRLLSLRDIGLIRLLDSRLMRAPDGSCLMAGRPGSRHSRTIAGSGRDPR